MLINAARALAAGACVIVLFLSLLILPVTLAPVCARWLGPLMHGVYPWRAIVAVIAAAPFGLAFGAIPVRNVALKSLGVSLCATSLILLFTAWFDGFRSQSWMPMALGCGLFVALFSCFAVVGNRLSLRFSRRAAVAVGTVSFLSLFAFVIVWPFYQAIQMIPDVPVTDEARLDRAVQGVRYARSDRDKFYALDDAAKESFVLGHIDDARNFANELLRLAPQFETDWNYGNAIQDSNLVLGRIAVTEGRIEEAKQFLLKAGSTRGSPQLDSFGPNMSLAKDLLEKGERETVLRYFEQCAKFWTLGHGDLDRWAQEVRSGKIPDFGPNLVY